MYFWELNNYGKLGWAIALIYSVCCVLRLARFNLTKTENNQEWKDNFFEGIPSPAGGILILMPLIYELSDLNFKFNAKGITPYLTILIALLLVSKVPTFLLKNINFLKNYNFFTLSCGDDFYSFVILYFLKLYWLLHLFI